MKIKWHYTFVNNTVKMTRVNADKGVVEEREMNLVERILLRLRRI